VLDQVVSGNSAGLKYAHDRTVEGRIFSTHCTLICMQI